MKWFLLILLDRGNWKFRQRSAPMILTTREGSNHWHLHFFNEQMIYLMSEWISECYNINEWEMNKPRLIAAISAKKIPLANLLSWLFRLDRKTSFVPIHILPSACIGNWVSKQSRAFQWSTLPVTWSSWLASNQSIHGIFELLLDPDLRVAKPYVFCEEL